MGRIDPLPQTERKRKAEKSNRLPNNDANEEDFIPVIVGGGGRQR